MFFKSKNKIAFRGPVKYFDSAPPVLGRSGDGQRTIFQVQPDEFILESSVKLTLGLTFFYQQERKADIISNCIKISLIIFFFSSQRIYHCTKKMKFSLRISSVNVPKSAVSFGFGHIN